MCAAFQFKQFQLQQDRCAMKVGTDGVLLGAWTSINHHPKSILDIGAGTGLLSLMMAQRASSAYIEAIEIDAEAFEQCAENFEASPWSDRLFCYHAALLEFAEEVEDQYDLIICNPPFYKEDNKTPDNSRNLARFQDAMPFEHLIFAVSKLMSPEGLFSLVLPSREAATFTDLATKYGLRLNRICSVRGNAQVQPKRSLMEFSFYEKPLKEEDLIVETARHQYTEAYRDLTAAFYLKM